MRDFENRPEFTPKYKSGKTSMATTAVLENWEPTKAICPECGSKHVVINTMCVLTSYPEQYQYKCSDCGHRWTGYKVQYIGPMQSWPSLEYEDVTPIGKMGWICPKCGGVFAPHMDYCTNCTQPMAPRVTCVDLGGGGISGTGMGSVSTTNESNTVISRNRIDGTLTATFGSVSEDSNGD